MNSCSDSTSYQKLPSASENGPKTSIFSCFSYLFTLFSWKPSPTIEVYTDSGNQKKNINANKFFQKTAKKIEKKFSVKVVEDIYKQVIERNPNSQFTKKTLEEAIAKEVNQRQEKKEIMKRIDDAFFKDMTLDLAISEIKSLDPEISLETLSESDIKFLACFLRETADPEKQRSLVQIFLFDISENQKRIQAIDLLCPDQKANKMIQFNPKAKCQYGNFSEAEIDLNGKDRILGIGSNKVVLKRRDSNDVLRVQSQINPYIANDLQVCKAIVFLANSIREEMPRGVNDLFPNLEFSLSELCKNRIALNNWGEKLKETMNSFSSKTSHPLMDLPRLATLIANDHEMNDKICWVNWKLSSKERLYEVATIRVSALVGDSECKEKDVKALAEHFVDWKLSKPWIYGPYPDFLTSVKEKFGKKNMPEVVLTSNEEDKDSLESLGEKIQSTIDTVLKENDSDEALRALKEYLERPKIRTLPPHSVHPFIDPIKPILKKPAIEAGSI